MSTKAIETRYAGHLFRSRLEARWAAYFDLSGWTWTYEPIDADGYIPDFLIHGPAPMMVEVKPATCAAELDEHTSRVEAALADHWGGDILILGVGPMLSKTWGGHTPSLGRLGQRVEPWALEQAAGWIWDDGLATTCTESTCSKQAVVHASSQFTSMPCGHYDGDHYMDTRTMPEIEGRWGKAHELTRWTGRR